MNQKPKTLRDKILISLFFSFLLIGCIDPVEPEFDFQEGLIYVEGFVSTSTGSSFVSVYESVTEFGVYQNMFLEGANVTFRNTETDVVVNLIEQEGVYIPPAEFAAEVGESWELYVSLDDGRQFQSLSERISAPVAISSLSATYNPELFFSEAEEDFVPGHAVSISFDDPASEANYYYWRFRSYEPIIDCEICYSGLLRNGACQPTTNGPQYFTYGCEIGCFQIRYNENVQIFADDFVNGTSVNNLHVANVPLYTKENVVVEIQQFSLSPAAYKYFRALKDILDNNGGFNAPPPAALIGNMFNPNDPEEYVLGRFTAAASTVETVFIDRSGISDQQLERVILGNYEPYGEVPDPQTVTAPCNETRFTTGITPQGWIE